MRKDLSQIFELHNNYLKQAFPKGLAGEEIEGIDLVLLDSNCAGSLDKFLGNKGTKGKLDKKDYQLLKESKDELFKVIPHLTGSGKSYFEQLEKLVDLTLNYINQTTNN